MATGVLVYVFLFICFCFGSCELFDVFIKFDPVDPVSGVGLKDRQ